MMISNKATEASRLQELNADVRDQDDLERDITRKVGVTSHLTLPKLIFFSGRQGARGESRGE